jgi:hypothetical protein
MFFSRKSKDEEKPPTHPALQDSRFVMMMPPEWLDESIYILEGPEDDGIQHRILLKIETDIANDDISEVAGKKIGELASSLNGFEKISLAPVQLQQPLPAYEIVYKWLPVENRAVIQRMMFVVAPESVYTLTVTFSGKTFNKLGAQVEAIFKSFSVPESQSGL